MKRTSLLVMSIVLSSACGPVLFSGQSDRVVLGPAPPPNVETRVEVADDKLVINEKIHFEFDSDVIKRESYDLLAEIAGVITSHPELARIRIEGHASAEGGENYNLDLSERRAKSVLQHLVEHGGIDRGRLYSEGFGESSPIASNDSEEGRAKNRRVEFMIVERSGAEIATAGKDTDTPGSQSDPAAKPNEQGGA